MFGRVLSALYASMGFLTRGIMAKFFLFFGLFYITSELIPLLAPLLPGMSQITSAFDALPNSMWYFLNLMHVPFGVSVCISAGATAFLIRRLPVIG